LGVTALLLAQSVLIAGLLVQRTRKQRAERQVREGETALRTSYERIRDLGGRLLNAQETERARVARELHDDISQQVALLSIDLELLGRGAQSPSGPGLAEEALSRTQTLARSVHDLSHRLHPAKLRLIGLVAALQSLQHELSKSGIAINFTHDNVPRTLPPDLTLCLFRIAQESLQNATKHSGARHVLVRVGSVDGCWAFDVDDDGRGFEFGGRRSQADLDLERRGPVIIKERVRSIGGQLAVESDPGHGARIEVRVPRHG
jgi:signal transduction histidine kinase